MSPPVWSTTCVRKFFGYLVFVQCQVAGVLKFARPPERLVYIIANCDHGNS